MRNKLKYIENILEYIENKLESFFMKDSQNKYEVYFDENTSYFYVKILDSDLYFNNEFLNKSLNLVDNFSDSFFNFFLSFIYPQSFSVERGELISTGIEKIEIDTQLEENSVNSSFEIGDEWSILPSGYPPITLETHTEHTNTFQMAA